MLRGNGGSVLIKSLNFVFVLQMTHRELDHKHLGLMVML
jgi:hypothetical protein